MTKEDNEDFENSAKCVICDNDYIDTDIKVRYHCHVTGKYRRSVHTDCNVNVKLYHKIPVEFHNLKKYDSHLTMQELGKINPKISFFYQMDWKSIRALVLRTSSVLLIASNFQVLH